MWTGVGTVMNTVTIIRVAKITGNSWHHTEESGYLQAPAERFTFIKVLNTLRKRLIFFSFFSCFVSSKRAL
jgi:mannosyltransferase OCH1-like enzyme